MEVEDLVGKMETKQNVNKHSKYWTPNFEELSCK